MSTGTRAWVLFLLIAWLAAPAWALPPKAPPPTATLLVTHPRASVLRTLSLLRRIGMLPGEGIEFVGVYHVSETESYQDAKDWLTRTDRGPFRLQTLDCPLDEAQVFQPNGCTEAFKEMVSNADGVLVTGGPDIPPALYGEPALLTTEIESPRRHQWEISFLYHLVGRGQDALPIPLLGRRKELPVLAICLGMQSLNVAAGGTLVQDIPSELYEARTWEDVVALAPDAWHRNPHARLAPAPVVGAGTLHAVKVRRGSTLGRMLERPKEPVRVLSIHHQAVEALGAGLRTIASSLDGKVVEAIEHLRYPFVVGVQFHPEHSALWNPGKKYRSRADADERNPAVEAMKTDERMRAFHEGIWRWLAERLARSAEQRVKSSRTGR